MNNKRVSIFDNEFDVSDFVPKSSTTYIDKVGLKELAEKKGFSSREPSFHQTDKQRKRRNSTGRNQQLNIRVTENIFLNFYKIADKNNWTLGETLEKCIEAFVSIQK